MAVTRGTSSTLMTVKKKKKKIFRVKDSLRAWTGPHFKGLSSGTTFLFTGKCFYRLCECAGETFVSGFEKKLENFLWSKDEG